MNSGMRSAVAASWNGSRGSPLNGPFTSRVAWMGRSHRSRTSSRSRAG